MNTLTHVIGQANSALSIVFYFTQICVWCTQLILNTYGIKMHLLDSKCTLVYVDWYSVSKTSGLYYTLMMRNSVYFPKKWPFLSLVFNIYFQMDYDISWLKRRCIDIHIDDYIQQIEKEDRSGADNLDTETLSGISVYTVVWWRVRLHWERVTLCITAAMLNRAS